MSLERIMIGLYGSPGSEILLADRNGPYIYDHSVLFFPLLRKNTWFICLGIQEKVLLVCRVVFAC